MSDLYEERSSLILRRLEGTITPDEQRRLDEIDAALEAVEIEEMRPCLERLEGLVKQHEDFAEEVWRAVDFAKSG